MCDVPENERAEIGDKLWESRLSAIMRVDAAGSITHANLYAQEILGVKPPMKNAGGVLLPGGNVAEFIPQGVFSSIQNYVHSGLSSMQNAQCFSDWRMPSGKHIGVIIHASPLMSAVAQSGDMPPLLFKVVTAPDTGFLSQLLSLARFLLRHGKVLAGIGAAIAGAVMYMLDGGK